MTMSRYCGFVSECPRESLDRTPFCNQTEGKLTCTICCKENLCNNGGKGKLLRPPPCPPVPEPLVKRLAENVCEVEEEEQSCSTSLWWTEESTVVNVMAICEESNSTDVSYSLVGHTNSCTNDNQNETGICITCCADGLCSNAKNQSATVFPILLCLLVRWLMTS
ncbi:uncharacterized protein [Diadema setosum]|uniref:uncharacterized protein n=1 Tax=Diadema antillarum TaxID=105358 RepID=UPI003A8ACC86